MKKILLLLNIIISCSSICYAVQPVPYSFDTSTTTRTGDFRFAGRVLVGATTAQNTIIISSTTVNFGSATVSGSNIIASSATYSLKSSTAIYAFTASTSTYSVISGTASYSTISAGVLGMPDIATLSSSQTFSGTNTFKKISFSTATSVSQIVWADGTVSTTASSGGGSSAGAAFLAANQTFTGNNSFYDSTSAAYPLTMQDTYTTIQFHTGDLYLSTIFGNNFRVGYNGLIYGESGKDNVLCIAIGTSGFIGMGTNHPSQTLDVIGNIATSGMIISSGTGNNYFKGLINASSAIFSGYINISSITVSNLSGTGLRAVMADASGTLSAPVSDKRLKINIKHLNSENKILQLNPVSFNYNTQIQRVSRFGNQKEYGLIAQEVEKILPELVFEDKEGWKGVKYESLIPMLLKLAQEQQKEIEQLKKEINKRK